MRHKKTTLSGRVVDEWTFQNADTQYLTHGLHPYPARMIPQLADKLIKRYSEEKDWVLDPFCGSGTILVECMLNKRNSIGNEINPFALLLAKVKTTPLDKAQLRRISKEVLDEVREKIGSYRNKTSKSKTIDIDKWTGEDAQKDLGEIDVGIPLFPNINLWFKEDVINELAILRNSLLNLNCQEEYIDFFKICLAFTAMKSSNADFESHQSHPSRYKPEKLKTHSPEVFSIFRKKVNDSVKRVVGFSAKISGNEVSSLVLFGDAKQLDLKNIAPSQGVDLIVTSPPYGEEQNTIGYNRWSRIMAYWIGFSTEEMKKSERLALGAKASMDVSIASKTANFFINLVGDKSETKKGKMRAARLATFFSDYHKSIVQMAKCLKSGGIASIVVGNRLVSGHRIAMDRVTIELAEQSNLRKRKTFYRDIPNTVMPKRIPEGETIARESIIVLEKM